MPTIFEVIDRLSFMRGLPAVYVVLITAVFIIIVRDWRLMLLALSGQYLVAGLLFVDVLDPRLAILKVFAGLFVCLILTITAQQVNYGRLPVDVSPDEVVELGQKSRVRVGPYLLPTSFLFRLFAALAMLLVMWVLSQRQTFMLPALPAELDYLNLAVYGLGGIGLLALGLTTDPLRAGIGVLMVMTGFELYYSLLEQSAAMLAMLAAVNLILALVITYLTQARHALSALVD